MQALKYLPAAALGAMLMSGPAHAVPAVSTAIGASGKADVISVSVRRHHYRYVRNRWRVVRPYATYGVYGPRPFYYAPYPFYLPFPFGFGVGFDPYYW